MNKTIAVATVLGLAAAGVAQAEPRAHDGFTRISASAGTRVEVEVGPAFSVDVSGRDAERVVTRVSGDTLIIEPRRTNWLFQRGPRDAVIRVAMPRVHGLDASSGATVRTRGVNGGAIELEASSGANLHVAGVCSNFTADASSGAGIRAEELRCETGSVDVSSGASVHIFASNRINVDASSGGDVIAHGNPGIDQIDLSSGGTFRRSN